MVIDYVFTTKLGNFLALMIFCIIIELPIFFISQSYFNGMVVGSFVFSILLSIFNSNDKWV